MILQMDIQYIKVNKNDKHKEECILIFNYYTFVLICRWFKRWGFKIDSERAQRKQKAEQIGENLDCDMLPLEHIEKKDNKQVTTIKETPCAYVADLHEKITSFINGNAK